MTGIFSHRLPHQAADPVDALANTLRTVQESGGDGVDDAVMKDLKRRRLIELGWVLCLHV